MQPSRAPARCRRRSWRPTAPWSAWRPARPRSSTTCRAGRLARDGDGVVPIDGPSLRERRKLLWNGAAAATLVIDSRGRAVAAPQVSLRGIDDEDGELSEAIVGGPEGDAGRS